MLVAVACKDAQIAIRLHKFEILVVGKRTMLIPLRLNIAFAPLVFNEADRDNIISQLGMSTFAVDPVKNHFVNAWADSVRTEHCLGHADVNGPEIDCLQLQER